MRLWNTLISAVRVSMQLIRQITLIAEANPIIARKSMPTSDRPHAAIITVTPAKITALPAVPTAVAIASMVLNHVYELPYI